MKKIIVSFAIITALIIGCKTSTKSNDAKTLRVALEPKSKST
ncbi:superoxide dismutase, partial [Flavobacterium tructae]